MSILNIDHAGHITTLTINRPDALNALNSELVAALAAAVCAAADDANIRAVILTGAGEKAFSAGADLKQLANMGPDVAREVMAQGQRAFRAIERAAVPVVAAVNGLALGGGCELILASTVAVLSTKASMGLPESGLGLIPGYGGTQRLPRLIGEKVAAHLMLTGARLSADRAYALGVTPLPPVAPDELQGAATVVANTIAAQGPLAVRSILHALDVGRDAPIDAGLSIETGLAALAVSGEESTEGIRAFLERRPAQFANSMVAQ